MSLSMKVVARAVLAAVGTWGISSQASATELQITITNDQPANSGFGIAPLWVGLQNGAYTTFTSGGSASSAVETAAELGSSSGITSAFTGNGPETTVGGGRLAPGGTATALINVANPAATRYLDYLQMVVPSNDFFLGNANPAGVPLFDASGNFTGTQTIVLTGSNVWDAGTEVDNIAFGAADVVGDNATDHVAANGTVTPVFGGSINETAYLNSILGVTTADGYVVSHLISAGDPIETITITAVPEPSAVALLGGAVLATLIIWRFHGRVVKPRVATAA